MRSFILWILPSYDDCKPDYRVLITFLLTPICLALIHYVDSRVLARFLTAVGRNDWATQAALLQNYQLFRIATWAGMTLVAYVAIPAAMIKWVFRLPLSDFGLRRMSRNDRRVYFVLLAVMMPLVFLAAHGAGFQSTYPFYIMNEGEALYPRFVIAEGLYLLQFASLEFFFRGFMVHALKHRFGYYSVFIMTIPYTMIHFVKPPAEALAAVVAGVVLGAVSLQSRSILLGVAIHVTVALSLDITVLWQKGALP